MSAFLQKQGIGTIHKATRYNANQSDLRVSHWPNQAMTQTVSPLLVHICWSSCVPVTGTKDMGETETQAGHELTTWNIMEDQVAERLEVENCQSAPAHKVFKRFIVTETRHHEPLPCRSLSRQNVLMIVTQSSPAKKDTRDKPSNFFF